MCRWIRVTLGILAILLIAMFFPSCNCNNVELLGEAEIVVYKKGEQTILDPHSPYYRELQAACEEMLINSAPLSLNNEEIIDIQSLEETKNEEWAIEITYTQLIAPQKILAARELSSVLPFSQILIPLSGDLTSFNMDDTSYNVLFTFLVIKNSEYETEMFDLWKLKNQKDIQEIKDILARFDINVP